MGIATCKTHDVEKDHTATFRTEFRAAVQRLGYSHFAVLRITAPCDPITSLDWFTNLPQSWVFEHHKLITDGADFTLNWLLRKKLPLDWALIERNASTRRFFDLMSRYGMETGLSCQQFGAGGERYLLMLGGTPKNDTCESSEDSLKDAQWLCLLALTKLNALYFSTRVDVNERFTPRELETLLLASKGLSFSQIADVMGVTERTINHFMTRSSERLGVHGRSKITAKMISSAKLHSTQCDASVSLMPSLSKPAPGAISGIWSAAASIDTIINRSEAQTAQAA